MEEVDKTIEKICKFIQAELEENTVEGKKTTPRMIEALAALLAARY